jgi:hypothetical protein
MRAAEWEASQACADRGARLNTEGAEPSEFAEGARFSRNRAISLLRDLGGLGDLRVKPGMTAGKAVDRVPRTTATDKAVRYEPPAPVPSLR